MAEEHLLVCTMGMMTTEEVVAAMKTSMTHGTVGHGAPEMITLGAIIGMMIDPNPPPKKTQTQLNLKPWSIPKEDYSFASTSCFDGSLTPAPDIHISKESGMFVGKSHSNPWHSYIQRVWMIW